MAVHVIRVPDLGEGIAEVELVVWHVAVGDAIVEDQGLADVMTDKASVEIPSPVAGKVLALGGEVGQMLAVGSELIRIEVEDAAGATASKATPAPASAPAPVASQASPPWRRLRLRQRRPRRAPSRQRRRPCSHRRDRRRPRRHRRRSARSRRPPFAPAPGSSASTCATSPRPAAPAASSRPTSTPTSPAAAPGRSRVSAPRAAATSDATHEVKIVGLRRKIAQKMQESKRRIPHYTYVEEVDVTEIEALRAALNEKWGNERGRLTLLAFLVRAVVLAVREFPMVNARFDDEAGVLTRHDAVHVGIATQTPAGLVVPVVRDAQANDLWSNAAEIARLADAARSGKAVRAELTGSTITITSLGKLGGIVTTPVINHPEVAIVGVNKIAARPVIRDGAVVARQLMNLSSSFDHRVVDGADAAAFIQSVRRYVEQPAMLFVE